MKPGRALLIVLLALGVLLTPLAAEAQPPGKVVRIGVLTLELASSTPPVEAFRQGLREHGYVEGQNIALEFRFAEGRIDSSRPWRPNWFASRSAKLIRRTPPIGPRSNGRAVSGRLQ
jgi:hypothetical protein